MATVQQQTTQLEFHQAMADFKTMFPDMDDDVIEAVLRSNQGAVDATIDQLLAMTTDNENEKIRHELDEEGEEGDGAERHAHSAHSRALASSLRDTAGAGAGALASANATLKTRKNEDQIEGGGGGGGGLSGEMMTTPDLLSEVPLSVRHQQASPCSADDQLSIEQAVADDQLTKQSADRGTPLRQQLGWVPPLLGQLPDDFLRLTLPPSADQPGKQQSENELLEDERIALFLQNEEFMAELRWNKDFLLMLDKDSPPEERLTSFPHSKTADEDAIFKERLRNMGKMSRKKFSQLARVFTGRKKRCSAKQILNQGPAPSRDNLLLQEDDSDGV